MLQLCKNQNLIIEHGFGWLRRKTIDIPDHLKKEYDSLSTISEGLADSIIAHKYPMLAECYTIILKKENI